MTNMKNHVQLIGRLGAEPQVKILDNGSKLTKFSIAINNLYTNKQGEKVNTTQWHTVITWGGLANIAERLLHKGVQVTVDGKLLNRQYTDKTGVTHINTEIVANELFVHYQKANS
ncbi:MAG: single-stranded DNA-binding protein [Bacteroidetes bacterium]|jgi:single-strand DNA-binding protein|nr:single-stranded DNA-binding protein [Bacteroidota bacterium]MCA6443653.1 single-stranded DNA-binding protein [Bacteroidota bacterium]